LAHPEPSGTLSPGCSESVTEWILNAAGALTAPASVQSVALHPNGVMSRAADRSREVSQRRFLLRRRLAPVVTDSIYAATDAGVDGVYL
jgi:hypothetical protein